MRFWFKPVKTNGFKPVILRHPGIARALAIPGLLLGWVCMLLALPLCLFTLAFGEADWYRELAEDMWGQTVIVLSPWEPSE